MTCEINTVLDQNLEIGISTEEGRAEEQTNEQESSMPDIALGAVGVRRIHLFRAEPAEEIQPERGTSEVTRSYSPRFGNVFPGQSQEWI